eukprot:gnl/TRDRNA2_/TRDRNA2_172961_c0_seq2.p1 gnl/TRDRNA2_/TRDRNA2_172961_c0~~gnl/TRDRNA2_/TRDRNA2_172961_c0_seq2.p1  ORF type:complete len:379 (-),score=124.34 gnl/TRDRNA2_/TRDRNA2_172961_c0_seq2:319-1362(-)
MAAKEHEEASQLQQESRAAAAAKAEEAGIAAKEALERNRLQATNEAEASASKATTAAKGESARMAARENEEASQLQQQSQAAAALKAQVAAIAAKEAQDKKRLQAADEAEASASKALVTQRAADAKVQQEVQEAKAKEAATLADDERKAKELNDAKKEVSEAERGITPREQIHAQKKLKANDQQLKKTVASDHWKQIMLSTACCFVALLAVFLYALISRMSKQRRYHYDMLMRLNAERMRCVERIRELSDPLMQAGSSEVLQAGGKGMPEMFNLDTPAPTPRPYSPAEYQGKGGKVVDLNAAPDLEKRMSSAQVPRAVSGADTAAGGMPSSGSSSSRWPRKAGDTLK